MKYPTDIWVDVIATCVMHVTQAWLDKSLQDIQLGQRNAWNDWAMFRQKIKASFMPMLEAQHARHSLLDIRQLGTVAAYIHWFCTLMYKYQQ